MIFTFHFIQVAFIGEQIRTNMSAKSCQAYNTRRIFPIEINSTNLKSLGHASWVQQELIPGETFLRNQLLSLNLHK